MSPIQVFEPIDAEKSCPRSPSWLRAAFPDVRVTIEEMLEAEGNRVIVRTKTSGTHRGVFMGIAPGSKPVSWPGVNFLEVRDGSNR